MRLVHLLLVWLLCLAAPAAATSLEGGCAVRFFGDSTLHAFEGTGGCEPFSMAVENADGKNLVRNARVEVNVASLDTDIALRNKQMRAMFDSEHFPRIVGRFGDFNPDALLRTWEDSPDAGLDFDLTIRDVSRPVKARVHALQVTADQIDFTLDFTLSLSSFGLDAPTVLGIIRVADEVRLAIDVNVKKNDSTPATNPP